MPYIQKYEREVIKNGLLPESAGQLNFVISSLVDNYLADNVCYERINEVIGVLECAKLELYRRIAAPYEDVKIQENGDVYTCLK